MGFYCQRAMDRLVCAQQVNLHPATAALYLAEAAAALRNAIRERELESDLVRTADALAQAAARLAYEWSKE